ncbi:hypothetical protein E2562_021619 [Oryza meyeriana var. granulata]|uniref:Uncharacterized protein n=1 Tax=Oryza meyeriana var. granulata TaxID=110450 RepID=A0A6G1E0I4_9ORYZ|nr:hypothetical protein E2562_021619 [Oryza meyeriana var. granulata]
MPTGCLACNFLLTLSHRLATAWILLSNSDPRAMVVAAVSEWLDLTCRWRPCYDGYDVTDGVALMAKGCDWVDFSGLSALGRGCNCVYNSDDTEAQAPLPSSCGVPSV